MNIHFILTWDSMATLELRTSLNSTRGQSAPSLNVCACKALNFYGGTESLYCPSPPRPKSNKAKSNAKKKKKSTSKF